MKLKYIFGLSLALGCLTGCYDDLHVEIDQPEVVTVSLNFGGEITASDTPLTRASSGNDVYGIQVYKDGEPFAHGLFDNVDNVKINLLAGSKYKFVASMVKDAKTKLLHDFSYYESGNRSYSHGDLNNDFTKERYRMYVGNLCYYDISDKYLNYYILSGKEYSKQASLRYIQPVTSRYNAFLFPFCYLREKGNNTVTCLAFNHEITNEMMYNGEYKTDFTSLNMLDEGFSTMSGGALTYYPEVDRFYAEVDNYTPKEGGTLTLNMKRTGFGLKVQVTGITDGTLSVKIANDLETIFEDDSITDDTMSSEKIFTFSEVRDAWYYGDNYTKSHTVSVTWVRDLGGGNTKTQDLGSVSVSLKRNVMNIVRINLGTGDASSRMNISMEEDAFSNDNSVDVPFVQ